MTDIYKSELDVTALAACAQVRELMLFPILLYVFARAVNAVEGRRRHPCYAFCDNEAASTVWFRGMFCSRFEDFYQNYVQRWYAYSSGEKPDDVGGQEYFYVAVPGSRSDSSGAEDGALFFFLGEMRETDNRLYIPLEITGGASPSETVAKIKDFCREFEELL